MFERFGDDIGDHVMHWVGIAALACMAPWFLLALAVTLAFFGQLIAGVFGVAVPWDVIGSPAEAVQCR